MTLLIMNLILVLGGFSLIRLCGSHEALEYEWVFLCMVGAFFSGYNAGRSQ